MGIISIEKHNHIAHIRINRPSKLNAFTMEMIHDLSASYSDVDHDEYVRVIVVSAAGDHFTAGLDLDNFFTNVSDFGLKLTDGSTIDPWGITTNPITKPVIVTVQGTCLTLGVELILASELAVADETTVFGQLEVTRGIMPFGGATTRFAQRVGWANASRYLLTGETFSAQEGLRIGLINEVVPKGTQVERAMELARLIAEQAPLAVQATLRNARVARAAIEKSALSQLPSEVAKLLSSDDFQAGVASFTTRSKPEFTGH